MNSSVTDRLTRSTTRDTLIFYFTNISENNKKKTSPHVWTGRTDHVWTHWSVKRDIAVVTRCAVAGVAAVLSLVTDGADSLSTEHIDCHKAASTGRLSAATPGRTDYNRHDTLHSVCVGQCVCECVSMCVCEYVSA